MNLYNELRNRQQTEYNAFPVGFAFNQKQLEDQLVQLGLKPIDTDKVIGIGFGGFIRKTDKSAYMDMLNRHKKERELAIKSDKDGSGFIKDMFSYELANHEYDYTGDLTDTLEALGLSINDIQKDKKLKKGLQLALRRYR
ncbi:MAG: hypothetical protein E7351_01555 [Clostridiales bacterium]|nr:hypothetical protein [Clostridiales bacterium]